MRPLAAYEPVLSQIMRWLAHETHFVCRPDLHEVLQTHPRMVIAISHCSPLSWLPSTALLALETHRSGGGERHPMGVMDNVFFQLPLVKDLAHWLTQSDRPLSFHELAERFETRGDIDIVLFPEGSNCFFGRPDEIQDFRSPKFVELAIRAGAPILVVVHRGSEKWATAVPVSSDVLENLNWLPNFAYDFFERRLRKTGLLTVPLLPLPMERFEMLCEIYEPQLKPSDLSSDPERRREQVRAESENVRAKMSELLAELAKSSNK